MTTFGYELEDLRGQKSIELDLPFSGEWSQGHSIAQGDLNSDCTVILNARLQDRLVSEIFEVPVEYSVAFVVILKDGQVANTDLEFEILSDYDFDSDESIRQRFVSKVESGYSEESVRIV